MIPYDAKTIPELFERQAASHPRKPLFYFKAAGQFKPVTWEEARQRVHALAAYLVHCGVAPGDRVLLLSENRCEWALADLAIMAAGGISVPIYPSLTAEDAGAIAANAEPVLAIGSNPEQIAKLQRVRSGRPGLKTLIAMDGPDTPEAVSWTTALTEGSSLYQEEALARIREGLRAGSIATLIYTSGTTGEPKGVMLSHSNLLSNAGDCLRVIPIRANDLHLSFLPLSHVFERMAGLVLMLMAGAAVAYAENMDTVAEDMLLVRPTVMLGVPRFFEKLHDRIQERIAEAPPSRRRLVAWALDVGRRRAEAVFAGRAPSPVVALQHILANLLVFRKLRSRLGGRLRFFVSGSAPLNHDIARFFYYGGIIILEGYGLTETSPVIAVNRLNALRIGSVGPLLDSVQVRIAEDGEILTRGPHVMQGYYRNEAATREVINGGWFATGDIGKLEDGYLYITDRKKDLIKTAGGKFVAPQKLESRLCSDPLISQALVIGDRRPFCIALVVPDREQVLAYAKAHSLPQALYEQLLREPEIADMLWKRVEERQRDLPRFEQVKKIVVLPGEFSITNGELTPTMKAKRRVIAERHAAEIDAAFGTA